MADHIHYEGLDLAHGQIRLLTLHPPLNRSQQSTDDNEPLYCDLKTHTRGSCPPYTALSYAWQHQGSNLPVIINKTRYEISETVVQALKQLRQYRSKVYVWVDQICINQNEDEEKSHQVQQMRQIYSDADVVVSWLGLAFPNSNILFEHLQQMGRAVLSRDWKSLMDLHANDDHLLTIKEAFTIFCRAAYWTRLWVIQEFAVGRKLRIVCGKLSIEAEVIDAALMVQELLDRGPEKRRTKMKSLFPRLDATFLPEQRSFVDNLITRRQRYQDPNNGKGSENDHFLRVLTTSLVLELDYNWPLASDPRDRVFALLHLSTDSKEFNDFPDYSKSTAEVYYKTAIQCLKQGHIDIFSYCQFPKRLESLPTWIPDWSMKIRYPCVQSPWLSKFTVSGDTLSKQNISEQEPGYLRVQGISVDAVKEISGIWDPDWSRPLNTDAALTFIEDIRKLCEKSPRIRFNEQIIDTARIAVLDNGYFAEEAVAGIFAENLVEFMEGFQRLKQANVLQDGLHSPRTTQGKDDDWYGQALKRLHSRRPFITLTGFVGLCPSVVEPGDEVCIFFGGKAPYVVRPQQNGTYSLVGEAYVHGIMYGEFLKGNHVTKTFVLK